MEAIHHVAHGGGQVLVRRDKVFARKELGVNEAADKAATPGVSIAVNRRGMHEARHALLVPAARGGGAGPDGGEDWVRRG